MKRVLFGVAISSLMLTGCNKPSPAQIAAGISASMPVIVAGALVTAAKHSPDTVKSDAAKIVKLIDTDVLPLVQNNALSSAVFLPQLEAKLIQIVPQDYEMLVTGAFAASLMAGNIDLTLPAMTPNEKTYVLAFVTGIRQGCALYLAGKQANLYGPSEPRIERAIVMTPPVIDEPNAEIVEIYCAPKPQTCKRCEPQTGKPAVNARQRMERHWDSEGDGHGQGGYVYAPCQNQTMDQARPSQVPAPQSSRCESCSRRFNVAPVSQSVAYRIKDVEGKYSDKGTCFAVDPHHLVTAAHVAKDSGTLWIEKGDTWVKATRLRVDHKTDIALVETSESFEVTALAPETQGMPATLYGSCEGAPITAISGIVDNHVLENRVQPGCSGGPVLQGGHIVGMLQSYTFIGHNGCFLPSAEITKWLHE